jgi:pimeloyl-ACP methyl ester carboxylesterase
LRCCRLFGREGDQDAEVNDTRILELGNGRELAWIEYGTPEGRPVVVLHGSPGNRYFFAPQAESVTRMNVRLIAPDRPGYGYSTYHPGRTYETWARDVAQLVDHVGVGRFGVLGHSSGGPNAAACARFLGDRVVGCAIVSGVAPPEANIKKDAMLTMNRVGQRLAPIAPWLMSWVYGLFFRRAQRDPDKALAWMGRMLPACDRAVIERPEIRAAVRADLARAPAATAGRAATQDFRLELRPWGFRLNDIKVPVHVWHGDLDRNVVVESGVYQASEIPDGTLHRLPDAGHWLVHTHFEDIVNSLVLQR